MGLIDKVLIATVGVDQSMGKDGESETCYPDIQGGVDAWRAI